MSIDKIPEDNTGKEEQPLELALDVETMEETLSDMGVGKEASSDLLFNMRFLNYWCLGIEGGSNVSLRLAAEKADALFKYVEDCIVICAQGGDYSKIFDVIPGAIGESEFEDKILDVGIGGMIKGSTRQKAQIAAVALLRGTLPTSESSKEALFAELSEEAVSALEIILDGGPPSDGDIDDSNLPGDDDLPPNGDGAGDGEGEGDGEGGDTLDPLLP